MTKSSPDSHISQGFETQFSEATWGLLVQKKKGEGRSENCVYITKSDWKKRTFDIWTTQHRELESSCRNCLSVWGACLSLPDKSWDLSKICSLLNLHSSVSSLDPEALEAGIFLGKPREDEKPLLGCGMWAAAWEGTEVLQNRAKPSRAAWILQIIPSWDREQLWLLPSPK